MEASKLKKTKITEKKDFYLARCKKNKDFTSEKLPEKYQNASKTF